MIFNPAIRFWAYSEASSHFQLPRIPQKRGEEDSLIASAVPFPHEEAAGSSQVK